MTLTISYTLFFLIYGRYLYFAWRAGFNSLEAVIYLLLIPVILLLMISEMMLVPSLIILATAGALSFSKIAIKRYRHL
jgi:hypothetical protein